MNKLVSRKKGFTLIELLVVIAIIAILAAILFPVFARARESARNATCQSNLKQIAIGVTRYLNDWNESIPYSGRIATLADYNKDVRPVGSSDGNPDGSYFCTQVGAQPPNAGARLTWAEMLYEYLGQSKDIVRCPSGDDNSYWWKTSADMAGALGYGKMSNFAKPSDQVIIYEKAGYHSGDPGGFKNGTQMNMAFMDSHVRSVPLTYSSTSVVNSYTPPASGTGLDPKTSPGTEPYMYTDYEEPNPPFQEGSYELEFVDPRFFFDNFGGLQNY